VALVGPYGCGKTTLLESILSVTGVINRKGSITAKNTVGDSSAEARARQMSTDVNVATTSYLGDTYTFLDCPGSIEFLQETLNILPGVDAAIVVVEPDGYKAPMAQPVLKYLEDLSVPHFIFVNKIDKAQGRIRDILEALQPISTKPLVLRQVPIWENGVAKGFIDLALERAFSYRDHAASEVVDMPKDMKDREKEARFQMLERLADHDDHLMEELLSDVEPPRDEVFADLSKELAEGLIVPVLLGSAEHDNGIRRLLKALRHEMPGVDHLRKRVGAPDSGDGVVHVLKTVHGQGGKLSIARVLSGEIKDGATLTRSDGSTERVGGIFSLVGDKQNKATSAKAGETVALGRLEHVQTGETLTTGRNGIERLTNIPVLAPVFRLAVTATDRKDEVKLTTAFSKLREEDPSIKLEQLAATHELVLSGQGDIHLKVAVEKLASRFGLKVETHTPKIPYKETIRKSTTQRGRHKRQTGGHGQFGDVVVDIKPLPRGSGFIFNDTITGGVVPKQWIPSVEKGVREYLQHGPLGFPVVDVSVTLTDGSYHSVDSSDAAFQSAGRLAMQEGMPNCSPVLLEPIMAIEVFVPSDATAKVNGMVTGRRGQILGFDARPGWAGWDVVSAHLPESELHNLIVELRSATQGTGTYSVRFDHLAELTGKLADQVLAQAKAAA
jgi:elongation factor G